MKILYLLRGLPGCGKSTLAKKLTSGAGPRHFEADQYFVDTDGNYNFDASRLKMAHNWCAIQTQKAMVDDCPVIVVSNTFTQEWEMKTYYELAEQNGYTVFSLIVENRHGGVNEHGVPDETLEKMEKRFQLKLR